MDSSGPSSSFNFLSFSDAESSGSGVSSVDSNGRIEASEPEPVKEPPAKSKIAPSKPVSSTDRRLRMESFLSDEKEEEVEETVEPEPELSASEKLKKLKEEEGLSEEPAEEIVEEPEEEKPPKQEKKSKKRRGPPKGGSFGPTVGGF